MVGGVWGGWGGGGGLPGLEGGVVVGGGGVMLGSLHQHQQLWERYENRQQEKRTQQS